MIVNDFDAASPDAISTAPHAPNTSPAPDAAATTTENKTYVRQLPNGQEYPVA